MACYVELIVTFFGLALLINSLPISHAQYGQDKDLLAKVAIVPGNFTIVALFSVHEPSSKYYPRCGPIQDQAGMQRVEAALWELKRINEENKLKNYKHTFRLEIRDTCGSDEFAHQQGKSIYQKLQNGQNNPIVATVGPASSAETESIYKLIGKYMPQIGFSATAPRLTNTKDEFENFARLVPPDTYQARVIFDLIDYFGQSCVNVIITAGVYGFDALKAFKEITETRKPRKFDTLCIASEGIVYDNASPDELTKILANSTTLSGIVVCFCEGRTLRKLYQIADKVGLKDQVLFINSDGWTETDNMTDYQNDIIGSIMINTSPQIKIEDNFADYYYNLSNWNPSENPWKEEFYKHRFNCSFKPSNAALKCTGHETLEKNFFQDPKVPLVRYSIRTITDAINHFVDNTCRRSKEECNKTFTMKDFENFGSHFTNYTRDKNVEFGTTSSFLFNGTGDPNINNYEILSYAKHNGSFASHVIGSWTADKGLVMNESFSDLFNKYTKIENKCNMQCQTGYYRAMKNCCWTCTPCSSTSISNGNFTRCLECELCHTPNEDQNKGSACVNKTSNLKVREVGASICIFISLLCVTLTTYTAYVLSKRRKTPTVKFSSTHLTFRPIIFCGMGLAYSTTILNAMEPNALICTVLRFIPSISLTMIYGPILMKTNRISRALSAIRERFPTLRMKYLSAIFLVSVSLLFVFADIIVFTVQFMAVSSEVKMGVYLNCNAPIKIVFCPKESIVELNFRHCLNICLLVYCTIYAYRSELHLSDNITETKYIIKSCGATAVVWGIFLIAHNIFLQQDEDWTMKVLFLSQALSLSALINWVYMYFPQLNITLYGSNRIKRGNILQ